MSDPTSKYTPDPSHGPKLSGEFQKIKRAIDGMNSVAGPFTIFNGPLNINSGGLNVTGPTVLTGTLNVTGAATLPSITGPTVFTGSVTIPTLVGPIALSTVVSLSGNLLSIQGNAGVGMVTGNYLGALRLAGATGTTDISGVDFNSNSQTAPTARIGASFTGSGSTIRFGVSNNYASGITHDILRAGFDASATFTLKTYSPNQAGLIDDTADSGSTTCTLTGFPGPLTGTVKWVRKGGQVTINVPILTGTSNLTTMTLTGLPASLAPATDVYGLFFFKDTATYGIGPFKIAAGTTTIVFSHGYAGIFPAAWTNAAANGLPLGFTWTYPLS